VRDLALGLLCSWNRRTFSMIRHISASSKFGFVLHCTIVLSDVAFWQVYGYFGLRGRNLMSFQLMFFDSKARTQISTMKRISDFRGASSCLNNQTSCGEVSTIWYINTLWRQERFVFVRSIDLVRAIQLQEVLMLVSIYPHHGLYLQ
jgi:hypothetical protein